ncbi:hypothetical protein LDC_1623 [sediment metagenome]|uniref:Uncharacterized protein n=1 Tax=sediment metagenome TaxID=749907 RepID=D9PJB4_9ZZZZ
MVTDYRIFTAPFYMGTGANLLQQMEAVLGPYNPYQWRVFALHNGSNIELNSPEFADLQIMPGMGFWIITLYDNTVQFEGAPAPQDAGYQLNLSPGWHMIALPWPGTPVNLSDITVSDGTNTYAITDGDNTLTQQSVWDYTGSGPYSGYEKLPPPLEPNNDALQPGVGYFLKVLSGSNVTVTFPPALGAGAPAPGTKNATTTGLRSISRDNEEPPPGFPCKVTERAFTASPGLSLLPLPPDGLYDGLPDCPDCTGSDINREVKGVSFEAGPPCQCTAMESITIGPGSR